MDKNILILAIDQGTTSSRAILFDHAGTPCFTAQREFPQHFRDDGHVEHDPEDIWTTTVETCREVLELAGGSSAPVIACGITNQRETTVIWDRHTGKPIHNAIVWQDRRTARICSDLKEQGAEALVQRKTGLLLDPYFSATKIAWILDHVDGTRERAKRGELAFGTVDCFLLWRLTEGREHATDVTNASRTALFDIHNLDWDEDLLKLFDIPRQILPQVKPCAADFGTISKNVLGQAIPIGGIAGDQQAATIGQGCFKPGMVKSTYGTGCFVIANTGSKPVLSRNRLLSTIAYQIGDNLVYGIEGSIFIAGAAMQWLRDGMKIIENASESQQIARDMDGNSGVYLVPAFTGLGAPWWDPDARGAIFGLTRDTGPQHFVRAALESVAYQTCDLIEAMAEDGLKPASLRVDGGMVGNDWLMQFLCNMLAMPVERPQIAETTALGAACLAGLQIGVYDSLEDIAANWQRQRLFTPNMDETLRKTNLEGWKNAITRVHTNKQWYQTSV